MDNTRYLPWLSPTIKPPLTFASVYNLVLPIWAISHLSNFAHSQIFKIIHLFQGLEQANQEYNYVFQDMKNTMMVKDWVQADIH